MNWLMDNPISRMPGPTFLAFYAALIVGVIVEARWRVRRGDDSLEGGPEPIPKKPDPVEIAYLRGGSNEVTRLLVFDLIRRGYLRVDETVARITKVKSTTIRRADDHAELARLSPVEAEAFRYFGTSRQPSALFQPGGLAPLIKVATAPMADSLREARLLSPADTFGRAWRAFFAGALMILAFGGFKVAVAIASGRYNVGFLLFFGIVGLVILPFACHPPRLTRRGKDYLLRLRLAFQGLKPRAGQPAKEEDDRDPSIALVPAVYGVGVLVGTRYAYAPQLFQPAAGSSGSCGGAVAGCGGASSGCGGGGGGGCGGGCGGCGGG